MSMPHFVVNTVAGTKTATFLLFVPLALHLRAKRRLFCRVTPHKAYSCFLVLERSWLYFDTSDLIISQYKYIKLN